MPNVSTKPPVALSARVFSVFLLVVGCAYAFGGFQLMMLGGTYYYLITGASVIASGLLMWRGNAYSAWIYALVLSWTYVWAIWEVGVDFWTLLPRILGPFGFGLFFLLPGIRKSLNFSSRGLLLGRTLTATLSAAVIGLFGWGYAVGDQHETRFQGDFPDVLAEYKADHPEADWNFYGNDRAGTRFSPLNQINGNNVAKLEVAWTYQTGELGGRFEATPLKINDTLYFCTPVSNIIALDAETGKERWKFDAKTNMRGVTGSAACRGVAYYETTAAQLTNIVDKNRAGQPLCARRIISPAMDARLLAVDASTGEPCADFGTNGQISLIPGMGEVIPGYIYTSSAPQIVRGHIVVGGWVSDGQSTGEPSGVIRSFNALTGAFEWAFDMGNENYHGLPSDGDQFTRGTPNAWAPISADEELGMVYLPTGNATPDYWGGHRRDFDNKFSGSILALNAETGERVWSFQTVHYDVWDMDVSSQPSLIDLEIKGEVVPALVQLTKRGQNFVLNRRTGAPIYEVKELPVPQGGVEDPKRLSPTQPFSVDMPTFAGMNPDKPFGVDERDMWGITPFDQIWCRIEFQKMRWEGPLTPPGEDTVMFLPGSAGGSNWGSASYDPERKILVAQWNRLPMQLRLMPRPEADSLGLKAADGKPGTSVSGAVPQMGVPYAADLKPFLSPLSIPCLAPPYALVTAVDLQSRKIMWERRSGTVRDTALNIFGMRVTSGLPIPMGVPGFGGSVTTRGGLTFIAASGEETLRAMDVKTGDILWRGDLPAGGNSTPMTYLSNESGRQFVVIAAGGHNFMQTRKGDYIVAYALPKAAN